MWPSATFGSQNAAPTWPLSVTICTQDAPRSTEHTPPPFTSVELLSCTCSPSGRYEESVYLFVPRGTLVDTDAVSGLATPTAGMAITQGWMWPNPVTERRPTGMAIYYTPVARSH
eukprot:scaffold72530_cov64-Phaeocystis_antarctica.AAC.7